MYTLRRILEDGYEYNFLLGKSYTLILKERVSKEEWDAISERYWGESYSKMRLPDDKNVKDSERDCFGFVQAEGLELFLLPWQKNYIMIDGKTFSTLSV